MREFPQVIKAKRVTLRRIRLEDAAGWKQFNNAIAKRMDWPIVPSVVYARNEILHYTTMWEKGQRYVYSVIDAQGKIIGDFHLKKIDNERRTAEVGHAFHPRVWGTGVTYEPLAAVAQLAKRLGYSLWGRVDESNIRSRKSLEKYKAKFIGTRTVLLDKKRRKMRYYELN